MSKYDDSYEDKILRIKAEFINFLRKGLEKNSDDMVDQKEIKKIVYEFIFNKVSDREVKGIKKIKGKNAKKVLFFKFFVNTVDWCLSYSDVIISVLSDLKRYGDLEMYEVKDEKIIDA